MEKREKPSEWTLQAPRSACSACAGDYEDPDRTAPDEYDQNDEGEDAEDE